MTKNKMEATEEMKVSNDETNIAKCAWLHLSEFNYFVLM